MKYLKKFLVLILPMFILIGCADLDLQPTDMIAEDAVKKDPKTYEHIDPKLIGNHRNIIVSNQAGRSNILSRLEAYGIKIDSKDKKVQKILDEVKEREFSGTA